MALDVTIILQNAHCLRESEGGSEPYIWPVLLWIDDTTLGSQDLVGVTGPVLGDARVVLRDDMSAGQAAQIPFPLGTLGVRFEDSLALRYVLLVVALFEKDETPEAAMWAGCQAFSSELRAAIAERLSYLLGAIRSGNEDELDQLITEIKTQVRQHTESVTWNALTGWQKTRVVAGTLDLDDFIGADYYFSGPSHTILNLSLKTESSSDEYTIDGMLEIRPTGETVDLCQAQVDRVKATKTVVDGIEGPLNVLKAELQHAAPAQKASIVAQITQLNQDLTIAMTALDEARQALQTCRDHWTKLSETRAQSTATGLITGLR